MNRLHLTQRNKTMTKTLQERKAEAREALGEAEKAWDEAEEAWDEAEEAYEAILREIEEEGK